MTLAEKLMRNMSRAEKRKSKADFEVCLETCLFLASKLKDSFMMIEVREAAERIFEELQIMTIPEAPRHIAK